ncbi:hypothetical protein GXW78_11915 [Roseomonas terrae]|uniref:Uncharacterized protein n=1 Tax=Neoroseomonas terrae TaxID=424799 RepID=A0ABS5EH89_9PROT|nr:hypothetical protein [Neoroseomonas terrae]MBR0650372.1 hypothetical protein [Neoroseomonas terrae]
MRQGAILEAVAAEGGGTVYRVRVIRAGLSRNRRNYPADVLRAAVPLVEGARVFVKSDAEHLAFQGKDVRNLIGGLTEPRWVEAESAIEARLTLITGENDPIAVRIREALARGVGDLFGLSIDADAVGQRDTRGITQVHPGAGSAEHRLHVLQRPAHLQDPPHLRRVRAGLPRRLQGRGGLIHAGLPPVAGG